MLQTEVEEPVLSQGEAGVEADLEAALAVIVLTGLNLDLRSIGGVLHLEVDDAGNRIGPVLRGGSIAEDLDTLVADLRRRGELHHSMRSSLATQGRIDPEHLRELSELGYGGDEEGEIDDEEED